MENEKIDIEEKTILNYAQTEVESPRDFIKWLQLPPQVMLDFQMAMMGSSKKLRYNVLLEDWKKESKV
jgi:hypothetical protein